MFLLNLPCNLSSTIKASKQRFGQVHHGLTIFGLLSRPGCIDEHRCVQGRPKSGPEDKFR